MLIRSLNLLQPQKPLKVKVDGVSGPSRALFLQFLQECSGSQLFTQNRPEPSTQNGCVFFFSEVFPVASVFLPGLHSDYVSFRHFRSLLSRPFRIVYLHNSPVGVLQLQVASAKPLAASWRPFRLVQIVNVLSKL